VVDAAVDQRLGDLRRLGVAADEDAHRVRRALRHLLDDLEAGDRRHALVGDDDVEAAGAHLGQRGDRIAEPVHLVAAAQRALEEVEDVLLVVDEQEPLRLSLRIPAHVSIMAGGRGRCPQYWLETPHWLKCRNRSHPGAPRPTGSPLSRRRVLATSPDLDQLRRIVANLERAGAEVDAVRSPAAVEGEIIPHRYIFFSIPDRNFDTLQSALPRFRQKAHIAVILPQAQLGNLTRLLADPRVNHVIVGEELDRGVFVTAQKLLTGDIFGIEKYLPEGTPVHYLRLHDF